MGSVRSSNTTYSSGLFGRGRHNSVYSNPEAGPPGPAVAANSVLQHKMSLYDRLVGRKSGRGQHRGGGRQGAYFVHVSAVAADEEVVHDQVWGVNGMCEGSVSCVLVTAMSGSRPYGI